MMMNLSRRAAALVPVLSATLLVAANSDSDAPRDLKNASASTAEVAARPKVAARPHLTVTGPAMGHAVAHALAYGNALSGMTREALTGVDTLVIDDDARVAAVAARLARGKTSVRVGTQSTGDAHEAVVKSEGDRVVMRLGGEDEAVTLYETGVPEPSMQQPGATNLLSRCTQAAAVVSQVLDREVADQVADELVRLPILVGSKPAPKEAAAAELCSKSERVSLRGFGDLAPVASLCQEACGACDEADADTVVVLALAGETDEAFKNARACIRAGRQCIVVTDAADLDISGAHVVSVAAAGEMTPLVVMAVALRIASA